MGCGASSPAATVKNRPSSSFAKGDPAQSPPWDYFVSHVQSETKDFAVDLWSSLRDAGAKVWLDVKMNRRDEEAMRYGVKNSDAVVVILSKSYFDRPFCVKEIAWACEFDKPVIPCVPSELKGFIGEFGGHPPRDGGSPSVAAAPGFLRGILSINVEELNRSDNEYWEVGVRKVLNSERKSIPLRLEDGVTLQRALSTTLDDLERRGTNTAAGGSTAEGMEAAVAAPTDDAVAAPPPPTTPPPPSPPMPGAVYAYVAVQRPPVLVGHKESFASFASCLLGFKGTLQRQEKEWRKRGCCPVSINDGGKGRACAL